MDDDFADSTGQVETDVLPGLAGVGRLVHPVALDVARPNHAAFAGADVDGVGIGRRDGDVADRLDGLVVEDRIEGGAAVGRLPHAARRVADVVRAQVARDSDGCGDASRRRRPHVSESQRIDRGRLQTAATPAAPALHDVVCRCRKRHRRRRFPPARDERHRCGCGHDRCEK